MVKITQPDPPAPGVTQDPHPPDPDNGAPELATDWVELLLTLILFESPEPLIVSPFRLPVPPPPFPELPHI
jgi:hypothetical protein